MHDGLLPGGSRPSRKAAAAGLVPRVLLQQRVVIELWLWNRHEDLVRRSISRLEGPRAAGELAHANEILTALAFRRELVEPLLQNRIPELLLIGCDDRSRS